MSSRFATIARMLVSIASLASATGCATTGAATTATTPAATSEKWDRVELASGVELRVSEEAGPEAQRVVEMIRSEMRSRYLSAR